ncbi:YceI family protein [Filimonas effusa]|uniref:YceI family protein n=1 Tax=Filimonas effusa TaxID=2508721 RepID=A0A4Q1D3R5_9BACT|nr:YceI family protein [Filimonas effusa]RXK82968.1 YceI family protein [Filimonas effusa]
MKKTILLLALVVATGSLFAQKKTTTSATVSFDATTPADALPKADNNTVIAALDPKTGDIQFEATVQNFAFTNPTIQSHFNGEKWLNSEKYPKFTFKGKLSKADFKKDGTYPVTVTGNLTVKETTKEITTPATVTVKAGVITATAAFPLTLADYGIVTDGKKIAKEPKITVTAEFK